MNYVNLASTGVKVSRVCLGTMTFGKEADEAEGRAIMDRAFDAGINFFDTANIYNKGITEEIVGRWIKERRDSVVLASKCHFPTGDGVNERGSSRRHILRAVEDSLLRLQTDWIDLLYLHHWDDEVALEQSLAALDTLVRQGKVMYCGVSNFSAWQTMKAAALARSLGLAPIVAIQPMYNIVKRQAEVEILPLALSENIAVCPYNPLAAGLLTGKYHRNQTGRLKESEMYARRYEAPAYWEAAARFLDHADKVGDPPAALALAWVMSHPAVTSTIIGARSVDQFNDTVRGAKIVLTSEERQAISALSPAPPRATDRES